MTTATLIELPPDAEQLADASREAFGAGDVPRAVQLAYDATDADPSDPAPLRNLAFMLEVSADTQGAVNALRRLKKLTGLRAEEEFQLSALLCGMQEFELAADHAATAVAMHPESMDFARHAANLFGVVRRHGEAVRLYLSILRVEGEDPAIYFQLSQACVALGRKDLATTCGARACQLEPAKLDYLMGFVDLMVKEDRHQDAIDTLQAADETLRSHPSAAFMLSFCLAAQKRFEDALAAIEDGVAANPDRIDLRMHRGSVLCCLRRYEDAVSEFEIVLGREPGNETARRASFAALTEAGLYERAVARGAELLASAPEDRDIGRTLQVVLGFRFNEFATVTGPVTGLDLLRKKREAAARITTTPKPPPPSAFVTQIRVILALLLREINTKYGRTQLGYVWAVFEPLAHIGLMITLIASFGHGKPPYGDSFAIFYFTGIIPYHLAVHTSSGLLHGVESNRSVLQIPLVTTFDVLISRALTEFLTEICVAMVLLSTFLALGLDALPHDPVKVLRALFYLWVAATGVGLINACIVTYIHSWEKLWGALTGILYFSSGTFYVPSMMPVWLREFLSWNPVLQTIELVRSGYFIEHDPVWMSETYLALFALFALLIGVFGERMLRRRLLTH